MISDSEREVFGDVSCVADAIMDMNHAHEMREAREHKEKHERARHMSLRDMNGLRKDRLEIVQEMFDDMIQAADMTDAYDGVIDQIFEIIEKDNERRKKVYDDIPF